MFLSPQAPGRLASIDLSRGLLIVLMVAVHAATPCVETVRRTIQDLSILYIATVGFIMLAGYTVAVRYGGVGRPPDAARLRARALQLIVVMLYSDLLLSFGREYLQGRVQWTGWAVAFVTLEVPHTISGVLLPIAVLLLLLPGLYAGERRWGAGLYVGPALVLFGLVELGAALEPEAPALRMLHKLLWTQGVGGFPIFRFVMYGFLGFVTGRLLPERSGEAAPTVRRALIMTAAGAAGIAMIQAGEPVTSALDRTFLTAELLFLGILGCGTLLRSIGMQQGLGLALGALALLGRYALLAFVLHRVVAQALTRLFGLQGGGYGTFWLLLAATLALTYAVCAARMHSSSLDRLLGTIYL